MILAAPHHPMWSLSGKSSFLQWVIFLAPHFFTPARQKRVFSLLWLFSARKTLFLGVDFL
jgi:hypothetical protein